MRNLRKPPFICILALTASLLACQNPSAQVNSRQNSAIKPVPDVYTDYSETIRAEFLRCGVDEDKFYELMALSYRKFDQDFEGGWRAIDYKEGCRDSAGRLLQSYLTISQERFESNKVTLMWHTGQMLAGSNNYDEAIHYFRQTYKSAETQKEWNLYVDGTLAFLKKDKDTLLRARDTLANMPVSEKIKEARRTFLKDNPNITMPEGFVDDPQNLSVMNNLITCFDEPYSIAYGKCNKQID